MKLNKILYKTIKKIVCSSAYFYNNLPNPNKKSCTCSICGKPFNYRYTPMVIDNLYRHFEGRPKFVCADCMEKHNGGQLRIKQLKVSLMSVNYMFLNDLQVDNDLKTTIRLIQFIRYVKYLSKKYN